MLKPNEILLFNYVIIFRSQDIIDLTLIDEVVDSSKLTHKLESKSSKNIGVTKAAKPAYNKTSTSQPPKVSEAVPSQSPPRLTHSFKEQRHFQVRDGRPQPHGKSSGLEALRYFTIQISVLKQYCSRLVLLKKREFYF